MATPTSSSYACVSGGQINAGRHAWPAWRRAMAAGTVGQIGSNTWGSLDPKNNVALNPAYPANPEWYGNGFARKASAWNGSCVNRAGGVVWQVLDGGHADYAGNDRYKIDLMADDPAWVMVAPPSGCIGNLLTTNDGQEASGNYADGRPRATHTYNKQVYVPGIGPVVAVQGRCAWSANAGTSRTLLCAETTGEFSVIATNPDSWDNTSGAAACHDATRNRVWYRSAAGSRLRWLDCSTFVWTTETTWPYDGQSGNKLLIYAGEIDRLLQVDDAGALKVIDPNDGSVATPSISGTAASGFSGLSGKIGGDWDGARLLLWNNSSATGAITTLSPTGDVDGDAWQLGEIAFTGSAPGAAFTEGTYGKFAYIPRLRGCVLMGAVTDRPSFFAIE